MKHTVQIPQVGPGAWIDQETLSGALDVWGELTVTNNWQAAP
jgi:hypothetical protein